MEVSSYAKPAGIFSDDKTSFKPEKKERLLARILKKNSKQLYQGETCQKAFKGTTMGVELIGRLILLGQDPAVLTILSYLNWFELAVLLSLTECFQAKQALAYRAVCRLHQILVQNSNLRNGEGKKNFFCSTDKTRFFKKHNINLQVGVEDKKNISYFFVKKINYFYSVSHGRQKISRCVD